VRYLIAGLVVAAGSLALPAIAAAPQGLIVFTRVVDGDDREVFVVRPDGSGLTRLTDDEIGESAPVLSPDRRLIASGSEEELVIHTVAGRLHRRISVPVEGDVTEPRWSPSGRTVAFLVESCSDDEDTVPRTCADLWVARPDTGERRRLVVAGVSTLDRVAAYSWSPSGGSLVFERYGRRGLVLVDAVTGRTRVVRGTTQRASSDPSWSRRSIAFVRQRGAFMGYDVYSVRSDGRRLRRLARARSATRPVWSPNGRRLAFLDFAGDLPQNRWRVTVVRSDGSGLRRVGVATSDQTLDWSPSGSHLLWQTADGRLLVGRADGRDRPRTLARGSLADWRSLP
jgi:Tol biopolymer transport system component